MTDEDEGTRYCPTCGWCKEETFRSEHKGNGRMQDYHECGQSIAHWYDEKRDTQRQRVEELQKEFQTITEHIGDSLEKIRGHDEELKKCEKQIKDIKSQVAYEVSVETDGDGNRKFSNQTLRDSEQRKRLHNDDEYVNLKEDQSIYERELQEQKDRLNYLKYRFRAAQARVELEKILGSTSC